jgi:pimeloyl-[acyl-carrier protein] synthase
VIDYKALSFDHCDASQDHNQLAMLLQLQRDRPLYRHKGYWLFTRYADVHAALRDKRLINRVYEPDREGGRLLRALKKIIRRDREPSKKYWFHYADPPYHADVRKLIREELTRQMPDLRQMFQSIADSLLEKVDCNDEESVRKGFVEPFPAMVAAEIMGLPREKWRWFDELFSGQHGQDLSKSLHRMGSILREWLARPGQLPPGMISALSDGCAADNLMSEEGVLPNCVLFALAAYVNTRPLLEKSVGYLLRNPSEMDRMRREPDVVPTAVEEFLRYFSTTAFCTRLSTADVGFGVGVVPEGQWVKMALVAANHDPEVFADPGHVDLARHPNPHVALGGGTHFCVGASVGRAEMQVSLACLARHFR